VARTQGAPCGGGAARTLFGQTYEVGSLTAQPREETGSRRMRRARKRGLVPGVLYGRREDGTVADPVLLHIEEADLAREVRLRGETLENTLYDLTINGETIRVLPRQLQSHPCKLLLRCVLSARVRVDVWMCVVGVWCLRCQLPLDRDVLLLYRSQAAALPSELYPLPPGSAPWCAHSHSVQDHQ